MFYIICLNMIFFIIISKTKKIIDLFREIRLIKISYIDYISSSIIDAETILKSINYNNPIDIWVLSFIFVEMYFFILNYYFLVIMKKKFYLKFEIYIRNIKL